MPKRIARVVALCLGFQSFEITMGTASFAQLIAQAGPTTAQINEAVTAAASGNPRLLNALVASHFGNTAAFDSIRVAITAAMSTASPVELSNIAKALVGTGNAAAISSAIYSLPPTAQAAVADALVKSGNNALVLAVVTLINDSGTAPDFRTVLAALAAASGNTALAATISALPPPPSITLPSPQQLRQGSPN
jgi:hypothetical protein